MDDKTQDSGCPHLTAVQQVSLALGAPNPDSDLYEIIDEMIDCATGSIIIPPSATITSADNSIEVAPTDTGVDLSISLVNTDATMIITPPTAANPGEWNLSAAPVEAELDVLEGIVSDLSMTVADIVNGDTETTTINDTDTIVASGTGTNADPYELNFAPTAITAGPGITVDQNPNASFTVSLTPAQPVAIAPENVRYVAQSWDPAVVDDVHFTEIEPAYASILAETPAPSATDPYAIYIYPGTYSDIGTGAVSNVHLIGSSEKAVFLNVPFVWTAGAGRNAALAGEVEVIETRNMTFLSDLTVNTSAKAAAPEGRLDQYNVVYPGGATTTLTGRSVPGATTPVDFYNAWDSRMYMASVTQLNFRLALNGVRSDWTSYSHTTTTASPIEMLVVDGGRLKMDASTASGGIVNIRNAAIQGPWTATGGVNYRVITCAADSTWRLHFVGVGIGHVMETPYAEGAITADSANANVNRDYMRISSPSLVVGSNGVNFVPPIPRYLTADYAVAVAPRRAEAVDTMPAVTAQSIQGLTLVSNTAQFGAAYWITITQNTAAYSF